MSEGSEGGEEDVFAEDESDGGEVADANEEEEVEVEE